MILNQEQRADLREFFDHDKKDIFLTTMKLIKAKLRERPGVGLSEWDTLVQTISRDSKIEAVDEILRVLDDEMADQEVENV